LVLAVRQGHHQTVLLGQIQYLVPLQPQVVDMEHEEQRRAVRGLVVLVVLVGVVVAVLAQVAQEQVGKAIMGALVMLEILLAVAVAVLVVLD
jgi:hypothetical protein